MIFEESNVRRIHNLEDQIISSFVVKTPVNSRRKREKLTQSRLQKIPRSIEEEETLIYKTRSDKEPLERRDREKEMTDD